MAMDLILTIRKEVEDQAAGHQLWERILNKLNEYEGLRVSGHLTNHLEGYITNGTPND